METAIVAKVGLEPTRCEPTDFESDAAARREPNGSKTPEITVAAFAAFAGGPDRLSESAKAAAARLCRRLRAPAKMASGSPCRFLLHRTAQRRMFWVSAPLATQTRQAEARRTVSGPENPRVRRGSERGSG